MYGKHFSSMYSGSMVGAGAIIFAVMGYVVANQKPDRQVGSQVELNPKLLAAILGEKEVDVVEAIGFLCAPDENSRTKVQDGRRLIQVGQFDYQVVNGKKYLEIRHEDDRREANRINKAMGRARKKGLPLAGEASYLAALRAGDDELAAQILDGYASK